LLTPLLKVYLLDKGLRFMYDSRFKTKIHERKKEAGLYTTEGRVF
jgi:hypothetical protein